MKTYSLVDYQTTHILAAADSCCGKEDFATAAISGGMVVGLCRENATFHARGGKMADRPGGPEM